MKKLLCILLCLMMVIPSAISLAASEPITELEIALTFPEVGTTVWDNNPPSIQLSSGSCYVAESFWAYIDPNVSDGENEHKPMDAQHVITAGEELLAYIIIAAKTDYRFTDSTKFTANSNVSIYDRLVNSRGTYAFITLKIKMPGGNPDVTDPQDPEQPINPGDSTPTVTEKVTFSKLKSVKLTAVSAKKLKVSWKKLSSKDRKKVKKIEIQYSTDKKFKNNVKSKFVSSGKTSYTISGLKKNTKYYVRVRAYTKSGQVINLSKWVTKNQKTRKK